MELWDDGESATITALFELPGLGPDEVLLDVVDGRLVVSGSRRQRAFNSNRTVGRAQGVAQPASGPLQVRELKYGTFRRVVPVPPGCVTCDLEATLEHGMLTVSWPRYPGALTPEQDSPSDLSSDLPDTPTDALEPAARFGGNDASDVPS